MWCCENVVLLHRTLKVTGEWLLFSLKLRRQGYFLCQEYHHYASLIHFCSFPLSLIFLGSVLLLVLFWFYLSFPLFMVASLLCPSSFHTSAAHKPWQSVFDVNSQIFMDPRKIFPLPLLQNGDNDFFKVLMNLKWFQWELKFKCRCVMYQIVI